MLHRKTEIAGLRAELTQRHTQQDIARARMRSTAQELLHEIHDEISTDRSGVVPRIELPLAEYQSSMGNTPRRHRANHLLAARCLDGDLLQFTSNGMLCDYLHTLEFENIPSTKRRLGYGHEVVAYRCDPINEDSQVVATTIETRDFDTMLLQPSFIAYLGRAATLLQLAESGDLEVQTVDLRTIH